MAPLRAAALACLAVLCLSQAPGVPQGGAKCSSDWECSLGGTCDAGACVCDPWFTGPVCNLLNLAPAEPNQGLQVPNYHSWGGHAMFNPQDNLYHGERARVCRGPPTSHLHSHMCIICWRAHARAPRALSHAARPECLLC